MVDPVDIYSTEADKSEPPIYVEVNPTQILITQGDGECLEAIYMTYSQAEQLATFLGTALAKSKP